MPNPKLRLILEVEYSLNGASIEAMACNLIDMVQCAISEGAITKRSDATCDCEFYVEVLGWKQVTETHTDRDY